MHRRYEIILLQYYAPESRQAWVYNLKPGIDWTKVKKEKLSYCQYCRGGMRMRIESCVLHSSQVKGINSSHLVTERITPYNLSQGHTRSLTVTVHPRQPLLLS